MAPPRSGSSQAISPDVSTYVATNGDGTNPTNIFYMYNAMSGMAVDNCAFFYGTIRLENSAGINLTSGLVSCNVAVTGPATNRLAGNHIIPMQWQFGLSPTTIAEGNFTAQGPWEKNTR